MQLIGSEDERAIADSARAEHSLGGNLMTSIYGAGKPSKYPEHPQTVGTLPLRWCLGRPLDCRASSDVGFSPLCGKGGEAVEEILLHPHAETS
jgi:hypothetical protein